jgi:hypothetical protein
MSKDQKKIAIMVLILLIFYSVAPVFALDLNVSGSGQKINNTINSISGAYNAKPAPQTIGNKSDAEQALENMNNGWNNLITVNNSSSNLTDANKSEDSTFPTSDEGEDNWDLGDMLTDAVTNGIFNALNKLGDEGFKVGLNESADTINVSKNHGLVVVMIYLIATIEWDPSEVPFIQEMQLRTAFIGIFMLLMFIFMGATSVNIYSMTAGRHERNAYILANRYHLPINEYVITILEALLMMLFGYTVLRMTLLLEVVLSRLVMIPILDRIAPTGENTLLYLMFVLLYIFVGIAIGIRLLIIGLYHGSFMFFVGLYCFGFTRPISIKAFLYYVKVVFLRFAIILTTTIGVGIIQSIQLDPNLPALVNIGIGLLKLYLVPLMMVGLCIILLIISVVVLFELKDVIATTKRVYRAARGHYYI